MHITQRMTLYKIKQKKQENVKKIIKYYKYKIPTTIYREKNNNLKLI